MARSEPALIDRGRLLDQRQGPFRFFRARKKLGQLRKAARGVEPLGTVLLAVLRQSLAEHAFGLIEALLGCQHGAKRAQCLGRAPARIMARHFERASGEPFGRPGFAARQRDTGAPDQSRDHDGLIRRDAPLGRRHSPDAKNRWMVP